MDEFMEAIDIIITKNVLDEEEIDFMIECKKNIDPVKFLQESLKNENKIAISIFTKLEKFNQ